MRWARRCEISRRSSNRRNHSDNPNNTGDEEIDDEADKYIGGYGTDNVHDNDNDVCNGSPTEWERGSLLTT